jgi:predicted GNAT family N-acyltransferase
MEGAAVRIAIVDWPEAAARVMPLREAVFVVEQGVPPELERDAYDVVCRHAVATVADGRVVGTGRLLPDGHIGRMAVAAELRGQGIGARILDALVREAAARGMREVVLHAQTHAADFYARHGFVPEGEVFTEAGIAHRLMRRVLVGG